MTAAFGKSWRAALLPLGVIAVAQITATATRLESDSLASPAAIVLALFSVIADGSLLRATFDTLTAAFFGCIIGSGWDR